MTTFISGHCLSTDSNISQGSVPMHVGCGGIFNYFFTANLPVNLSVKEC